MFPNLKRKKRLNNVRSEGRRSKAKTTSACERVNLYLQVRETLLIRLSFRYAEAAFDFSEFHKFNENIY